MKFDLLSSASLIALGGALAVVSTPGTANATLSCFTGYCTETVSLGSTKTDFSGKSVVVDQFDNSGGKNLTSVVITANGTYNSTGNLINTSASTQSFSFKLGMSLFLSGGVGAPGNFPSLSITAGGTLKNYVLGPSASTAFNYSKTITSATKTLTTGLSGYLGTGTFDALFGSNTLQTFSGGGGNITAALNTFAAPSVTITYNFSTPTTPAPEPASLAVFGAALAGLGVVRRRRKG